MIIKNRAELATTPLRRSALDMIEAGIKAVLPSVVLPAAVTYDVSRQTLAVKGQVHPIAGRVFVVGGGKASGAMAEVIEDLVPKSRLVAGVVACKGGTYRTQKIRVVTAAHPIPDLRGVGAVSEMLALKESYGIGHADTIICLLSGGGSALLPAPAEGLSLADKKSVTELLLASGAEIAEINAVRKHISSVKGGRLGQHFAPAQVITLIISDVISNDLSAIASGLTYADPTTFADALVVLEKYRLQDRVPASVIGHLRRGVRGEVAETAKSLDNCHNYIIADNRLALEAMGQRAGELGLTARIVTTGQKGETTRIARQRAYEVINRQLGGEDVLILGGETTPVLPAQHGSGGRNQQFVAVSLLELRDYPGEWVVASVSSDGSDFLPDVSGAIIDNASWCAASELGLDVGPYVEWYDSNTLLKALGGSLVITGETGTNVGDIMLYLRKRHV